MIPSFRPCFAAVAVELVADAGRVHLDRGDTDVTLGHDVEAIIDFRHPRVRVEPVAIGKSDLERIVFGVLGRKVFNAERFAIVFDLVDKLQRNVMMMNVDGAQTAASFCR
jgi:hypothetical protein